MGERKEENRYCAITLPGRGWYTMEKRMRVNYEKVKV